MPDARIPAQEPTPAEAFSALPLDAPDRSAWPALAERIAAAQPAPRRRAARWLFAGAAAAALGAIALLPRDVLSPSLPDGGAVATAEPASASAAPDGTPDVDALIAESARLENLLYAVDAEALSASATALSLEYEERVQRIDVALSDPSLSADERTALWERRVDLLREHAGLQGTAQWLATQGGAYDGDLVAVF
jgi:hypothetical protein